MKILLRSIRRHPIALAFNIFVAFSVLWTITEALTHFFGWAALKDGRWFTAIICVSFGYALYTIWKPSHIVIRLPMSNVSIEVAFGDIFEYDGVAAIPVNEFYDTEIGLPVAPTSLHGAFIQRCYGGHPDAVDKQLVQKLANIPSEQVHREKGKLHRYPVGTCVSVEANGKHYFMFAFTHTDPMTCKASADVPQMFEALSGLWRCARIESNGNHLNLPLVGSGLSGVGLPARDLVNILILSFIDETKRQVITQRVRIILTWDRLDEVDLKELRKSWEGK